MQDTRLDPKLDPKLAALTNQSENPAVQYSYEPFGKTQSSNPSFTNPFQFTGRENDNTGLYYYRARYFSPARQRFIGEDPIGFLGGDTNLYAYVHNAPLGKRDPFDLPPFLTPQLKK